MEEGVQVDDIRPIHFAASLIKKDAPQGSIRAGSPGSRQGGHDRSQSWNFHDTGIAHPSNHIDLDAAQPSHAHRKVESMPPLPEEFHDDGVYIIE